MAQAPGVNPGVFSIAADWWKSKATWTAIVATLTAVVSAWNGTITWQDAVIAIFAAWQMAFIRDTVAKSAPPEATAPMRRPPIG